MTKSVVEHGEGRHYIVSNSEVLSGKPRITGTRIPIALILGYLAEGSTPDEIIREFPDLQREHITACLTYARKSESKEIE